MWGRLAGYFGIPVAPYPGRATPLAALLKDVGPEWDSIVRRHGLRPNPVDRIAPFWHVDLDFGREQETIADMGLSRERGFLGYQRTTKLVLRPFRPPPRRPHHPLIGGSGTLASTARMMHRASRSSPRISP